MGKPLDPAYWRTWRAAHPEYRARQSKLRAERRRKAGRGSRAAEYARRPSRATPPIPDLHQGHSLLEQAKALVGRFLRPDGRSTLVDPLYDDLVGEAVLALVAGDRPDQAVQLMLNEERQHRFHTVALDVDGGQRGSTMRR